MGKIKRDRRRLPPPSPKVPTHSQQHKQPTTNNHEDEHEAGLPPPPRPPVPRPVRRGERRRPRAPKLREHPRERLCFRARKRRLPCLGLLFLLGLLLWK